MAKLIVTIESNKEYDMSHKGMLFGIYSYHPPGPWVSRIVDFITDINTQLEEKGYSHRKISCNITNMTGPTAVLKLKGKRKDDLTSAINLYLAKSKILEDFTVNIK